MVRRTVRGIMRSYLCISQSRFDETETHFLIILNLVMRNHSAVFNFHLKKLKNEEVAAGSLLMGEISVGGGNAVFVESQQQGRNLYHFCRKEL